MDIGTNFKLIRQLNKKSQMEIAKETGISQKAISFWERNEREPTITNCIKLADYYNISLDELVGRDFF
ncbi:MAG: helix-turn-helix transcriptional regulator [Clostridiales bacterium]|nr:helix-turn-helix transcriptional regulator [Clostridiales bacterium]